MFYIYANGNLIYRPLEPELNLLSPKLTLEMGKAGSLEFGLPSFNKYYDSLSPLVTDIKVELDDEEIFFGRVLSSKKAFNNVKTVYCEGDLAYLVDSVQKCTAYDGNTHELFSKIVAAHNARVENKKQFTVGNVTIENRSVKLTGQSDGINVGITDYKQIAIDSIVDEWNNTYDFIKTTLIDYCGGYLRTRHENGVAYLDYVQDYFGTASQMIELGSNLLDLNDELKVDEIFTVLIPLGDDNLTIKDVNNGSDEWVDESLVQKYGRIVKTHVFSNVNSPSTLKENARRFMESNAKSVRTLEISAVDLHLINPNIQPIHLGDKVRIFSMPHDMDEELTCTKIEYDLTNPGNNKYTFGNPQQTLTERYREDARKQSDTYGNSAASSSASGGRSGGGAGAAAAAAAGAAGDKADENAQDQQTKLYNTYIKVDDKDTGVITLNTIYNTLKRGCSIELDPNSSDYGANIDIKAFNDDYNMNKENVNSDLAQIHLTVDDHGSAIAMNADNITANANKIELNADEIVNIKADVVNIDGRLEAAEAKFGKFYTEHGSAVTLNVSSLSVANGLYVNGGHIWDEDARVTTVNHYHSYTVDANGKITCGVASLEPTTPFDMSSTAFFIQKTAEAEDRGFKSARFRDMNRDSEYIDSNGQAGMIWQSSYKSFLLYLRGYLTNNETFTWNTLISTTPSFTAGQNEAHSHYHYADLWLGYSRDGYQAGGRKRGSRCTEKLWKRVGARYEEFTDAVYYDNGGDYAAGYTQWTDRGRIVAYTKS